MTETTAREFWKHVGSRDVIVSIQGPYPYTSTFRDRYGSDQGRIVDEIQDGVPVSRYFVERE